MLWRPGALAGRLSPTKRGAHPNFASSLTTGISAIIDPFTGRNLLAPGGSPTIAGTKIGTTTFGEARGYGSTVGVNTSDMLTTTYSRMTNTRTYAVRLMARGSGGGGFGRVFQKGPGTGSFYMYYSTAVGGNPSLSFAGINSGTATCADNAWPLPTGRTVDLVVTCTGSSGTIGGVYSGNKAFMNGQNLGIGIVAGASGGTSWNQTDVYYIGNRPDLTRNWDGYIGYLFIWDRALTDLEAQLLSADLDVLLMNALPGAYVPVVTSVSIYRPSGDESVVGWTTSPSVPVDEVYTTVDEATFDDGDYAISPNSATPESQPLGFYLNATLPVGTWDIKFRPRASKGPMGVIMELLGGEFGVDIVGTASTTVSANSFSLVTLNVTTTDTATKIRFKIYQGGLP